MKINHTCVKRKEKSLLSKIKTKPEKIKQSFFLLLVHTRTAGGPCLTTRVHILLLKNLGELLKETVILQLNRTDRQQEAYVNADQQRNATGTYILFKSLQAEQNKQWLKT